MVAVVVAKSMGFNLVVPEGGIATLDGVAFGVFLVGTEPDTLKAHLQLQDFDPRHFSYSQLGFEQAETLKGLVPGYQDVLSFLREKVTKFWSNYEGQGHVRSLETEVRDWQWLSVL